MTPTNLTECLAWLDETSKNRMHLPAGPAYLEWAKEGFPDRFAEFVASRVAECLRGHLAQKQQLDTVLKIQEDVQACAERVDKITAKYAPAESIKAPAPAALALAREDLGRCMRLAGMQGLVSREEFEKLRTRIVYAIAAQASPGTAPAPLTAADFTPAMAFANILRHWSPAQCREFYDMLSRRPDFNPDCQAEGEPLPNQIPGEMVKGSYAFGYTKAAPAPKTLPEVGGRWMESTIADFQNKCRVTLGDLQENRFADNALIALICDAVRMSREYTEFVKNHIGCRLPAHVPEVSPAPTWTREKPPIWFKYRWADEPAKEYAIRVGGVAWNNTDPIRNKGRIMEFSGPIPTPTDPANGSKEVQP